MSTSPSTGHNTPDSPIAVKIYLGDDTRPRSGFHQGDRSLIGDEWFSLYLDAGTRPGPQIVLTPAAVIALAKELDELRGDAETLLHAQAIAEGRAAA